MPRRNRCVLPEIPCHITQRGVDRREVFSADQDRNTYLRLLQENLNDAAVRVLGYCLMSNHVHLVAVPAREDSLSILLRRVHGRYAQYYNARTGRSGHLWQNRFFACMLGPTHLWTALCYVERNPVRAGIVQHATEYPWSSAAAHTAEADQSGILDMKWWKRERPANWSELLECEEVQAESGLRCCTYAGRPFVTRASLAKWRKGLVAIGIEEDLRRKPRQTRTKPIEHRRSQPSSSPYSKK
jgi:putative transposase